MKRFALAIILALVFNCSFGQNSNDVNSIVREGINYHDKGDYEGAIERYEKALKIDKDHLFALAEMAYTLVSMQKYEEAIKYCKKAIEKHPNSENLEMVYVSYGNALDFLKKTDQSLKIYDEGIKKFPDSYMLHFNKGIALVSVKRDDEALLSFQKSVSSNPKHASSNNAIAHIQHSKNRNVPAFLALCRFLIIEPKGKRAEENFSLLKEITTANVTKNDDNKITININSDLLNIQNGKINSKENNFTATELILAMSSALDLGKENANKTEIEKFINTLETIFSSLSETQKDGKGFYWEYYVPYFVELKEKNFIDPLAYILFSSTNQTEVKQWLDTHKKEVDDFYIWNNNYKWKTK